MQAFDFHLSKYNEANFKDEDYHIKYPTIFHLRKELMSSTEPHDVRLVFLAIHHIIKNRGHFLFEGQNFESETSLPNVLQKMNQCLREEFGFDLECSDIKALEEVLKSKGIQQKKKRLYELLAASNPEEKAIVDLIAGAKVDMSKIFTDIDFEEKLSITFAGGDFETKYDEIEMRLQGKMAVVEGIKLLHDWALLAQTLQGEKYISDAKIQVYEKHHEDLKLLKKAVKTYLSKELYQEIFNDITQKFNYVAYVGRANRINGAKQVIKNDICSQEDLCKYLRKCFDKVENAADKNLIYLKSELENNRFLPKQTSKENGIIPFQLHQAELNLILNNAQNYLPFLLDKDESGKTVKAKIMKLLTFRIPYYVGPLNPYHSQTKFAWVKRQARGRVLPWNFEQMVDIEESASSL